jgi:N-methylhydantoinase A
MPLRCGIDTGGTFTDLVGLNESTGDLVVSKWPSAPRNPLESIVGVVEESGISSEAISSLVLGTTVAINALIQRRGARVIYVTTEDVLHIQRINRRYHCSLEWTKPEPFVERRDCLGVPERVDGKGEVVVPLVSKALDELYEKIEERLTEHRGRDVAIAVNLLFSYLSPEHERRLSEGLRSRFPAVPVSVSHEVAPIWREFERGSTVVSDAYVKPILRRHLTAVRRGLDDLGLRCPWAVMKSGGGQATPAVAEEKPVDILLSGLSGGLIGGEYFGELAGEESLGDRKPRPKSNREEDLSLRKVGTIGGQAR